MQQIELDIGALKLAAIDYGQPDGVPTLGLHGWMDNAATFSTLAPLLDGVHLVALDLPGHGRSSWRAQGAPYHFIDWVPDVVAAADALGWERFALMGHSMGAGISTLVAGALAERVTRVVLLDGLGPMSTEANEAPGQMRRALEQRSKARDRPPRRFDSLQEAVQRRAMATSAIAEASAAALMRRNLEPDNDGGFIFRIDPRLRHSSLMRLTEAQVLAFLSAITAPTLVVEAMNSGWKFDRARMQRRLDAIAQTTRIEVHGGHHVHLDAPELLAEAVVAHLVAAR